MNMSGHRAGWLRGLFGVAMLLSTLAATAASPPERQWIGAFTVAGQATPLTLHERHVNNESASTVDLPSMGAREVPLTRFEADGDRVAFQLDGPPGR